LALRFCAQQFRHLIEPTEAFSQHERPTLTWRGIAGRFGYLDGHQTSSLSPPLGSISRLLAFLVFPACWSTCKAMDALHIENLIHGASSIAGSRNECSQAKSLLVTRLRLRISFIQRFQVLVAPHLALSDKRTVHLHTDRSESEVVERLREEIGVRASHSATQACCGRLDPRQRQRTTALCSLT
jgi:hypothetical protein